MRQADIIMRYHLKIDTDTLSDEEWTQKWNDLQWLLVEMNRKG